MPGALQMQHTAHAHAPSRGVNKGSSSSSSSSNSSSSNSRSSRSSSSSVLLGAGMHKPPALTDSNELNSKCHSHRYKATGSSSSS